MNTMEPQAGNKRKKAHKLENFKNELDLIIAEPKKTDKNELYLFSGEALSFESIVSSTKRNLHTLVVIRQSAITSLNGISELNNLRELWVVECLLEDLSDLQNCKKLKMLYLYSNSISQVPNMSKSPELKLLSLSGNRLPYLQNFDSMPKLEELYIANNRIKKVGNAFWQNSALSVINLAGNPLYMLKDLQNLSFISSLRSIVLADPNYGECPLVSLCNYRHFAINYLPGLTELDFYPISNEERSYVTGLFKSKMMFYNMLSNKYENHFLKSLKDRIEERMKRISEYREEIYLAKLEELRIAASEDFGNKSGELLFHNILQQIYYSIDADDAFDKQWIDNSRINSQILQRQLSLKVQHCGNMDFVEYLPGAGNALVKICRDICNDSLCQTIRKDLGISIVRVDRVTKVINNETNAFRSFTYHNERTNQDQTESDSVFKFLVRPVGVVDLHEWPFDVFEEEFFDATDVIISDCLAAADANWIKTLSFEQRSSPALSRSSNKHRLAILVQIPVSAPIVRVESPDAYHAMHPNYDKDTCQCLSVVEPEQVKPVFVVEYEYIFQNRSEKEIPEKKSRLKVAATNPFSAWPLVNFENLGHCLNLAEIELHKLRVINLSGRGIGTIDLTTSLPNLRELNLSFNKLTALPDSAMLQYVRILDVSFNDIESFEITTRLPLLENLNAAGNLGTGFVTILQMLQIFTPNLKNLDLKYNPFTDVTEIESMYLLARNAMPSLKTLGENIIENHIYSSPVIRYPWIIDIFERADSAKLEITRNSMASVISETNKSLTSPLSIVGKELENVQYINLSNNHLSCIEFVTKFPQLEEVYLENNLFIKIFIDKPVNQLTTLNLSGNFIITLDGLTQDNFPVLNYLNLCDNLITSLLVLGTFHSLTQFYCSHNRINKLQEIHNLKHWHGLKVVDISNNPIHPMSLCNKFIIFHISKIEYVGGECVTALDLLEANQAFGGALDKDKIMNMCNVGDLSNLKQLSIVNCAIKKVNLTENLLPNLKSLDLSQNQITTLWGLHTLKKLQVLSLSHNQVETSVPNCQKDFIVTECLFPSLNTLFLDYNGIRSLVELNLQNMPALKYLYLQHNELQNVNGLQKCADLETLVLDYNKIHMITEEDFHTDNNIKALFLENNKIKFLLFARRLSKINKLFISNNKVTDKDQLKYLIQLENLKEITILGNPLCKRTNHYKLVTQALITLTRVDGCSVVLENIS